MFKSALSSALKFKLVILARLHCPVQIKNPLIPLYVLAHNNAADCRHHVLSPGLSEGLSLTVLKFGSVNNLSQASQLLRLCSTTP